MSRTPLTDVRWYFNFVQSVAILGLPVLFVLGCAKTPTRPVPRAVRPFSNVDLSTAWSPDGKLIAFRRCFASSDGPRGLYVVPSAGGPIQRVAPGDFFWPSHLRFSPDGRQIVCVYGTQLYIVDIPSRTMRQLFEADFANYPDWSPDGRTIVCTALPTPETRAPGLYRFDLDSRELRVIPADSAVTGYPNHSGFNAKWSPDGSQIAFIEPRPDRYNIVLIDADGTGYRVLASALHGLYDYLRWYVRPAAGTEGIAFRMTSSPGGAFIVSPRGPPPRTFTPRLELHSAFSPDGEWIVGPGVDPVDSVGVLFVHRTDDRTGASRRQLTQWAPP